MFAECAPAVLPRFLFRFPNPARKRNRRAGRPPSFWRNLLAGLSAGLPADLPADLPAEVKRRRERNGGGSGTEAGAERRRE
jgi:hypothetical protein